MRDQNDRDRAIDRLLPQVLGGVSSTPCVDGETLAAWTDGMLRASEAARVEQHVADCGRCQAMLGAFVRVSPVPPPKESLWHRLRLGWVLPLATAAAAVALWVVIPGQGPSGAPESTVTLADARRDTAAPPVPTPAPPPVASPPAQEAFTADSRLASRPDPSAGSPRASAAAERQQAKMPADTVARFEAPVEKPPTPAPASPQPGALAKDATRDRGTREESGRTVAESVMVVPEAPAVQTTANVGPPKPPPPGAVAASPAPVPPSPPAATVSAAPAAAAPAAVVGAAPARAAAQAFERADAAADARVLAARKSEVAAVVEIPSSGASTRWRIVGGRRLERSTTGGQRWNDVTLPDALDLMAGASPSPQVCWVVGRGGRVYLTIDGERFTRVVFPEATDLVGVRATDARAATVTAADGRTFTTADGGTTWTR